MQQKDEPGCSGLKVLALGLALLAAAPVQAQDAAAGERLFRQRCAACHSVQAGQNMVGPHLRGVVGRKAGSVEGARYSQSLRELALTWDTERLQTYLANPAAMVSGTTMMISVPNAAERTSIAAYLESLH